MLKQFDIDLIAQYGPIIVGVDEVGMGPIAGPICACALNLDMEKADSINLATIKVDDSKKLSRKSRVTLFPRIGSASLFHLGWVTVEEIESIRNLNVAGDLARQRAYDGLVEKMAVDPYVVISDFFRIRTAKGTECVAIAKADSKSFIVACASIIAKVSRDRLMCQHHNQWSNYDWINNVGYRTPKHFEGILRHGLTPIHRKYLIRTTEIALAFQRAKDRQTGKEGPSLIP